MTSSPMFWAIAAAIPAVASEFAYRKVAGAGKDWTDFWWAFAPTWPIISYGVYRMVNIPGASLIDAFIVWALAVMALRVFASVVLLGDHVSAATWMALAMVVAARAVQVWGPK